MPFRRPPSHHRAAGKAERHARWYLLYYVLAALDIATVLACLALNQVIMQIYTDSVAVNERWQKREASYADLSLLACEVNAPGNDVFDSHDVLRESARLADALGAFRAQFAALRAEASHDMPPAQSATALRDLDRVAQAMNAMVGEARLIFAYFESAQPERAGERMATMDRKFANVNAAFSGLFADVRGIVHANFERQLAAAELIKRLEYVVIALALLMIAGALYYGRRLYRAAHAADAERAVHIATLDRARADAHAASEAKSKFLAVMSHEIRTPLNCIFLALDTLESPRNPEEGRCYAAMARTSGRYLERLVDGLLDLSRIDAGKLEFERVEFDLRRLLDEILVSHGRRARAKGVSLGVRVAPDVPAIVRADPLRVGQVVVNLVDNAVKFTEAGSVDVAVARRARDEGERARPDLAALRITVRDTGTGIAPGERSRIFEDFVQGEASTCRTHGGAGLGLAIVRRVVALMNGTLAVSDTPGGGATFSVDIDLDVPHRGRPCAPWQGAGTLLPERLSGLRVLVVEDGPEARVLTAAVLGQLGVSVDVAPDGAHAVVAAAAAPYDAIFMDLGLPGMDGLAAARAIRRGESGGREVPIIGLTGRITARTFDECLDAGMDDCLAKPVTRDALGKALRRWVDA